MEKKPGAMVLGRKLNSILLSRETCVLQLSNGVLFRSARNKHTYDVGFIFAPDASLKYLLLSLLTANERITYLSIILTLSSIQLWVSRLGMI